MSRRVKRAVVAVLIVTALAAASVVFLRWPKRVPIAEADTVIVYSPHPDDETYGMGQAIAEQCLAGRHVVGVLVTDGDGSGEIPDWIANQGTDMDLDGDVDEWDFGLVRRAEYRAAMGALGVDELIFLGGVDSQGESGFRDGELLSSGEELRSALESVAASISPETAIAHITVATVDQTNPLQREPREHADHTALAGIVSEFALERNEELYLYKVYVFYETQWWKRWAPTVVRGSDEAIARKQEAIEAYAGTGRSSTERLWTESYASDVEYLAVKQ